MRLFLAIELSSAVRESIAELQEELRPRLRFLRWVTPENLHLTLRFLGESESSTVQALNERLSCELVDLRPFSFDVHGFGCFPTANRARVVWVGVKPIPAELRRLHSAAETAVERLGIEPEIRAFQPHITIARLKRPNTALAATVAATSDRSFGRVAVSDVVLFESRSSPRGAVYRALGRWRLGGTGREQLV